MSRVQPPPSLGERCYLQRIATRLAEAGHGQKGQILREAMQHLSYSRAELYRRLAEVGYVTDRKTRSDKGKSSVDADTAQLIGGMLHIATRANGKRILAIKDAAAILAEQGKAPRVSAATISRALRSHHVHPQQLSQPTPHIQQRSLHPNHVWQIDASVCVLFYLPKGGLQVMEAKEFYKNKPKNLRKIENERVIRYVVTDHYSGALYVEYVTGAEDSINLTHVFLNAIQRRSPQEPFSGVPYILMLDKGSANTAGLFKNLMQRLGIQLIAHGTGNSRAKGSVEQAQNLVETKFESRLAFTEVHSLDHLNALATRWRTVFNDTATHTRTRRSRNAVWQTITAQQLRIAPTVDLCRELVNTLPETKTVRGDLSITHSIKGYGSQSYDVRHIPGIYPKAKLDVVVNPYRAPCIDILLGDGQTFTVEPQQLDWVGFQQDAPVIGASIRQAADSPVDQARKAVLKAAYDATTEAAVDAARKRKQAAYAQQIDPMADLKTDAVPSYLPRAGEQMQTPAQARQFAPLSHIEAAKRLRGLVGELWNATTFAALKQTYPEAVPADAIEAIADGIRSLAAPTKLRVVNE